MPDIIDMLFYVVGAIYSLGLVGVLRGNVRRNYAEYRKEWKTLDWGDVFFGFLFGLLRSAFWPITSISGRVTADQFALTVAGESDKEKVVRLEKNKKDNDARLLRLEREADMISEPEYQRQLRELNR